MKVKRTRFLILIVPMLLMLSAGLFSQQRKLMNDQIVEKVGAQVDPAFRYVDENGDSVRLGDLLDKPVLLTMVYYTCPGICTPLLSGVVEVFNAVDMQPGVDFRAITLSFNELEKPPLAMAKKKAYFNMLERDFPQDQWQWLTGDNKNIRYLSWKIGFNYVAGGKDFAHSAAIIVLKPDGTVSEYLHGVAFSPLVLKAAILRAADKLPSAAAPLAVSGDSDSRQTAGFLSEGNLMALAVLITLGLFGGVLLRRMRKSAGSESF